ncbi:MAG: right-handed parallel beta-helix repeat-containing protein [Candidatus Eisenbacteria bacterium]
MDSTRLGIVQPESGKGSAVHRLAVGAAAVFGLLTTVDPSEATIRYVKPDGTGDVATIQIALDHANIGDTILLADGVFTGPGNRELMFQGRDVTLVSESGDPESCIIDVENRFETRCMNIVSGETAACRIEGITIRDGNGDWYDGGRKGGGILVIDSSPTIVNCRFESCSASERGGALYFENSTSSLSGLYFTGNYAPEGTAIVARSGSAIDITQCVFYDERAGDGIVFGENCVVSIDHCTFAGSSATAVVKAGALGTIDIQRSIIAMNDSGAGHCVSGGIIDPTCTDIYGNATNWVGCLAGLDVVQDNLSLDPGFCWVAAANLRLEPGSPCRPENSPCGEFLGAVEEECLAGDGACCHVTTGQCLVTSANICAAGGSSWEFQGYFTDCDPNPCPAVNGSCCLPGGGCLVTNSAGCDQGAGEYGGNGTTCDPDPCDTSSVDLDQADVGRLKLSPPFPNPVTGTMRFTLEVPRQEHIRVAIFDATGREVEAVFDGVVEPGGHEVRWTPGAGLARGIYLLRATGAGYAQSERVVLVD